MFNSLALRALLLLYMSFSSQKGQNGNFPEGRYGSHKNFCCMHTMSKCFNLSRVPLMKICLTEKNLNFQKIYNSTRRKIISLQMTNAWWISPCITFGNQKSQFHSLHKAVQRIRNNSKVWYITSNCLIDNHIERIYASKKHPNEYIPSQFAYS